MCKKIFCVNAPNTGRENKSHKGTDRLIHLQYHSKPSPEKAFSWRKLCVLKARRPCAARRGSIHAIDFLVVNVPDEKPALPSERDTQALNYLKVYADVTANEVEEELLHNPQPAPPLGELTKDYVLQCYSNVFRPRCGNPSGTPMHIEVDSNSRPVHAQVKLDRVNEELERLSIGHH